MNYYEKDILNTLSKESFINQRILAEVSGHSVGIINRSLKNLNSSGYVDEYNQLTAKARDELSDNAPQRAIILAAGAGMRMVPINMETPKALLQVKGEPLIERQIKQLQEVGIKEIYVVAGFMKESLEYLIDEYGAELILNSEYSIRNNLHSLYLAREHLNNCYIVPCDIWSEKNPFSTHEMYSWYMVSDKCDDNSYVRVNRKNELVMFHNRQRGNAMIGISYLLRDDAMKVKMRLEEMNSNNKFDACYWEDTLLEKDRFFVTAKTVSESKVVEINTYEQLRELDIESNHLQSIAIDTICNSLDVKQNEINNISVLKKGMTNRSFLFMCKEKTYIMRVPGEGTDKLINRKQEADVYKAILQKNICDKVIYINQENGYKITEYLENARTCDPFNENEIISAMQYLRQFHSLALKVYHAFDLFGQIDFYESLWGGTSSVFKDYKNTKQNVLSLKWYIDKYAKPFVLTHIDAVPDNFLFVNDGESERIYLIDWEYAGMQDPDVDIAMFCIYSMYDKNQVDKLIDAYYTEGCIDEVRIKIYCYISVCGLLWSNWCEYKRSLGIEFGEYSMRQYRYAKEYYRIAMAEIAEKGIK